MSFVHLHNHSEYSFAEGIMKINALVKGAKDQGMSALALTDNGGLFGAYEFYTTCCREGIKPIMGLEIGLSGVDTKSEEPIRVILLAENNTGWKNLIKISSLCCRSIDTEALPIALNKLCKLSEGLICCMSGIQNPIGKMLVKNSSKQAKQCIQSLVDIFGKSNFFIEIQNHGLLEEVKILPELVKLGKELDIPLVASNNCLYLYSDDAEPYSLALSCRKEKRDNASREVVENRQFFLKSAREMEALFNGIPDALKNTTVISERCSVTLGDSQQSPLFSLPEEFGDPDAYLKHLCEHNLSKMFPEDNGEYRSRLKRELEIIRGKKCADYLLIVNDYVRHGKELGYLISDRGSACGSLVNYLLGITTVDPLKYNLVLERFLNPERGYGPDIDLDISGDGKSVLSEYLTQTYGKEKISRAASIYHISEEQAIRRIAEKMDYSPAEIEPLVYSFLSDPDETPERKMDQLLFKSAVMLTGCPDHIAPHPCGIMITPENVTNTVPVCISEESDIPLLQFSSRNAEDIGLIKFDLIGSKNLTLFKQAMELIETRNGEKINLQELPVDDPDTFQLFKDARVKGVFLFGSKEMREYVSAMAPENIEHLAALLALCRPGPKFQLNEFVACRQGKTPVRKLHPLFDKIVKNSFGFIIYQEQIQQIGQQIGGMSLGVADQFRRCLGKKLTKRIKEFKPIFMNGAEEKGVKKEAADEIFSAMERVCRYTFNKAHAVTYAQVSYFSAYLKTHYPLEFATAFINTYNERPTLCENMLEEAEGNGLKILPPDINVGKGVTAIEDDSLRLGLSTIRYCGPELIRGIIDEREKNGPFENLIDLCIRLEKNVLNRKNLTALIFGGATSCFPESPAQKFAAIGELTGYIGNTDFDTSDYQMDNPIDSMHLIRELASRHIRVVKDLSFDVYCPKTYSHHFRLTLWLPPEKLIFDLEADELIEQARSFVSQFEIERNHDYAIGLNSRVDQYSDKHLLMLDLDSIDENAIEFLRKHGGYLLKSGRGYHFIGDEVIPGLKEWKSLLADLQQEPALREHIDPNHIEMSLRRGYSTLRILESPAKPQRPIMMMVF